MFLSLNPQRSQPLHLLLRFQKISSFPNFLRWVSTKSLQNLLLHFQKSPLHQSHSNPEFTLISALRSCSANANISGGQQIHALLSKTGLDHSNTNVHNSLINMYAKCGFLDESKSLFEARPRLEDTVSCNIMIAGYVKTGRLGGARKLFDEMPAKGCVSYTTMILGLAQNEFWSEAIGVFKEMRNGGVIPTEVTLASVISACSYLGRVWDCKMLHGLVIKMMLDEFVLVSTNLLHFYCGCLSLGEARALFDEMPEKNIVSWNVMLNGYSKARLVDLARDVFERIPDRDVVSWGTIIDGYVRVERLNEALMMYRSMVSMGMRPNGIMVVDLVSACAKNMAVGEGMQFHSVAVKKGFDSYDIMQATIIHFYATLGRIDDACLQFDVGIKDHIASCNALMAGFTRNRMIDQARKLFDEMPERDIFSWSTIISGYAQSEQPDMALKLFREMVTSGSQPSEVTMVSVFSAIATLGRLEEGRWAHEYVRNNSIPLSDNLSTAIIDMYAKCGSINTALEVFHQIRDKISTISPWNAIICGLAMHGRANLSLEIYADLQGRRIKLNAITFIGVLSACCHAGLVELGEKIFKSMNCAHNIDPDIKHYGCMVDLLGRAGRLKEAEEMIRRMPMNADVVIWGTLLAACRTHGNVDIGQTAAEMLARLEPSHGGSKVLLSNIYADAGRWGEAFSIRRAMQSHKIQRLPGYSGVT